MVSGAVILPSARPSLFNQIVVNPHLASAVALVLSTPLGAAKHAGPVFDGRRGQLTVATPRREGTFVTDGRLYEAEWSSAALLTGFSQFFPADGVAAKDSTEVLVFYIGHGTSHRHSRVCPSRHGAGDARRTRQDHVG